MPERDKLDRERYLIDLHLLLEEGGDKLHIQALRLASLSRFYKEVGHLKDAICEMKRSLMITKDRDCEIVLAEWEEELSTIEKSCPYGCGYTFSQDSFDLCPGCNRLITICSECNVFNRFFDPYCRWCGAGISNHPSDTEVKIENLVLDCFRRIPFEYLSPPPVMVGDLAIIPLLKERSLLALKASNGEMAWKLKNVFASDEHVRLSFCYPYLYVCSTKRVERFMMELETLSPETIYNDPDSLIGHPSFPLVDKKAYAILFPTNKGILFHDIRRKRGNLFQMDVGEGDGLFPIATAGTEKFILSKKGKIYKLSLDEINLYCSVSSCEITSPPVSPTGSNWVYFESYFEGSRMVNAWTPGRETVLSKTVPDTLCSSDDVCFHNPPLPYKDGVLLIHSQEPVVYYAKSVGNGIDLYEIQVDISAGVRKVVDIEYLFSLTIGSYLISRIADGFFYINLDDPIESGVEFFGNEMVSRPLVFNNRLILLCKDGVRCYTF